jgi:hypothetical protein
MACREPARAEERVPIAVGCGVDGAIRGYILRNGAVAASAAIPGLVSRTEIFVVLLANGDAGPSWVAHPPQAAAQSGPDVARRPVLGGVSQVHS